MPFDVRPGIGLDLTGGEQRQLLGSVDRAGNDERTHRFGVDRLAGLAANDPQLALVRPDLQIRPGLVERGDVLDRVAE